MVVDRCGSQQSNGWNISTDPVCPGRSQVEQLLTLWVATRQRPEPPWSSWSLVPWVGGWRLWDNGCNNNNTHTFNDPKSVVPFWDWEFVNPKIGWLKNDQLNSNQSKDWMAQRWKRSTLINFEGPLVPRLPLYIYICIYICIYIYTQWAT